MLVQDYYFSEQENFSIISKWRIGNGSEQGKHRYTPRFVVAVTLAHSLTLTLTQQLNTMTIEYEGSLSSKHYTLFAAVAYMLISIFDICHMLKLIHLLLLLFSFHFYFFVPFVKRINFTLFVGCYLFLRFLPLFPFQVGFFFPHRQIYICRVHISTLEVDFFSVVFCCCSSNKLFVFIGSIEILKPRYFFIPQNAFLLLFLSDLSASSIQSTKWCTIPSSIIITTMIISIFHKSAQSQRENTITKKKRRTRSKSVCNGAY